MSTYYVPGAGLAVVVDGTVALLPDGCEPDMVTALWSSLLSGGGMTDHLQVLLAPGLAGAPSFALVRVADGSAHVVVRGSAVVVAGTADGERTVGAAHVSTWTEETVADVTAVRLSGGTSVGGSPLPVAAAVVPASEVTVRAGAAVPLTARVERAPEAGPPALPVRPAPPVRPQAVAEPAAVAEPEVLDVPEDDDVPEAFDPPQADGDPDEYDEPYGESFEAPIGAPITGPVVVPAVPPAVAVAFPVEDDDLGDEEDGEPLVNGVPVWSPVHHQAHQPELQAPPERVQVEHQVPVGSLPARPGVPVMVGAPEDHDGLTVLSSDVVALRRQLPEWAGDAVPQLAVPTPRTPAPAKLLMSTGLVVSLNRPVLIGRAPQVTRVTNNEIPRLITVASPNQDISRTHAEVRMDGEDVVVTDLRSTNGVLLLRQGQGAQRLHPGEPTVVEPGVVVDLGEGVTFLVEAGG